MRAGVTVHESNAGRPQQKEMVQSFLDAAMCELCSEALMCRTQNAGRDENRMSKAHRVCPSLT